MTRIEQEKITLLQMVALYCHGHKHEGKDTRDGHTMCKACAELFEYACVRLDHCKYGNSKPTCRKCPVHCYKPDMRQKMKTVMRYSGPRMLWHHPIAAIRHLINERK